MAELTGCQKSGWLCLVGFDIGEGSLRLDRDGGRAAMRWRRSGVRASGERGLWSCYLLSVKIMVSMM